MLKRNATIMHKCYEASWGGSIIIIIIINQVSTTGVLCGRQEPTKDQQQGGRVECWCDLLPVSVRQEAVRPQPEPGYYPRREHHSQGHRGVVRQQTHCQQ